MLQAILNKKVFTKVLNRLKLSSSLIYLGKALKRCGAATAKALSPKFFKVILPSVTYGLVLCESCFNANLFYSLERLHRRAARIIFNLSKDMRSSDVLIQADWHPLSYCYKLVLLKLMHKAFHDELPQVLSDNIVTKRSTGYSLRASDSLTVPRFTSIYAKNSVAHRDPVLWNILISKDKNFSNTSYKNLKRKIRSMDIFKELTFKETSTTTTNFRREDFNYVQGILEFLTLYTYIVKSVF